MFELHTLEANSMDGNKIQNCVAEFQFKHNGDDPRIRSVLCSTMNGLDLFYSNHSVITNWKTKINVYWNDSCETKKHLWTKVFDSYTEEDPSFLYAKKIMKIEWLNGESHMEQLYVSYNATILSHLDQLDQVYCTAMVNIDEWWKISVTNNSCTKDEYLI